MKHRLAALVIVMLLAGTAVDAQSLKLRQMFAGDRIKVAEEAKEASDACGTPIAFQVDYTTYGAAPTT